MTDETHPQFATPVLMGTKEQIENFMMPQKGLPLVIDVVDLTPEQASAIQQALKEGWDEDEKLSGSL